MAAKSSEIDRRSNGRHPIELKVEYKRLNTFFADYTKNISKGGTFIGTDKPLDIGTELVFALSIPPLREPRARSDRSLRKQPHASAARGASVDKIARPQAARMRD